MMGVVYSLLAAVGFALTYFLVRVSTQYIQSTTVTLVGSLICGALAFGGALLLLRDHLLSVSLVLLGWFALIAFVQVFLARNLSFVGIQLGGAARTTPILSTVPLWGTLFGVVFLHEQVTPLLLAGTFAVTAGVMLILTERGR